MASPPFLRFFFASLGFESVMSVVLRFFFASLSFESVISLAVRFFVLTSFGFATFGGGLGESRFEGFGFATLGGLDESRCVGFGLARAGSSSLSSSSSM